MCNVTIGAARAAALFACTLAASFAGEAWAQSTNVNVNATVTRNCRISTTPLAFGNYDPVVAHATTPLTGTGTVTLVCTRGIAPRITLSLGQFNAGATRRMASSAERLTYQLYRPPNTTPGTACGALTQVWGTSNGQSLFAPAAPSSAPRTWNVCGRIPAGQNVAAGSYSDTVVATVIF